MKTNSRKNPEISAGSLADIAFLLLIFFMITTTWQVEAGLRMLLPPARSSPKPPQQEAFHILLNARSELLIQEQLLPLDSLSNRLLAYLDLYPKAPVHFESSRASPYGQYVAVLDEIHRSYYQLQAEFMGVSPQELRRWNTEAPPPALEARLEAARERFPIRISEKTPRLEDVLVSE